MNTYQINKILSKTKSFKGTFSRDNLPPIENTPTSIIVNTDGSEERGEHWVAMYFTSTGVCEYFDSFGFPPLHQDYYKFIESNTNKPLVYSCKPLQKVGSDLCGTYCIQFIIARSRKISYKKFLSRFSRNTTLNDKKLSKTHAKYIETKI